MHANRFVSSLFKLETVWKWKCACLDWSCDNWASLALDHSHFNWHYLNNSKYSNNSSVLKCFILIRKNGQIVLLIFCCCSRPLGVVPGQFWLEPDRCPRCRDWIVRGWWSCSCQRSAPGPPSPTGRAHPSALRIACEKCCGHTKVHKLSSRTPSFCYKFHCTFTSTELLTTALDSNNAQPTSDKQRIIKALSHVSVNVMLLYDIWSK